MIAFKKTWKFTLFPSNLGSCNDVVDDDVVDILF